MRVGIYPGSFDPITNGHLDIIERACKVFDKVIVAVSTNSKKDPLFPMEERVDLIKEVLLPFSNVEVDYFNGLTVNYVEEKGAIAIIRGLRAISDFENEFQMALTNKRMKPLVETVFMMADADYSFLSSSLVKELAQLGGNIDEFVPAIVKEGLIEKYKLLETF